MNKIISESIDIKSTKQKIKRVLRNGIQFIETSPDIIDIQEISYNEYMILKAGCTNKQEMLFITETDSEIKYSIQNSVIKYTIIWNLAEKNKGYTNVTQSLHVDHPTFFSNILNVCSNIFIPEYSEILLKVKKLSEI